jgi:hypothetical protein
MTVQCFEDAPDDVFTARRGAQVYDELFQMSCCVGGAYQWGAYSWLTTTVF